MVFNDWLLSLRVTVSGFNQVIVCFVVCFDFFMYDFF